MSIPKAFISYSHDSQEHKKWVLDFATRLRNTGVDAILDQWELQAGDDLPLFMERHLADADRILMICTERYVEKANIGVGGVGYEKMIITADLLQKIDSNKVIPVIRQQGTHHVPTFLKSKLFMDFSRNDDLEFNFDELVRALHKAPLFVKPPVGNNPFTAVADLPQDKTGDPMLELMRLIVTAFESGDTYPKYANIFQGWTASRVLFDVTIAKAIKSELIYLSVDKLFVFKDKGKEYAITHKLV